MTDDGVPELVDQEVRIQKPEWKHPDRSLRILDL